MSAVEPVTPASRRRVTTLVDACDRCLRRTDLIAAVSGHLDVEWKRRRRTAGVLALPDDALLGLDANGHAERRYRSFDPAKAREALRAAGLAALCRCASGYPDRLRELDDPPAVLHVAGSVSALYEPHAVAIVGARRATAYGLEVASAMGRDLAVAGLPVVSGMALGIDSSAHGGALQGSAPPVAVLAGSADLPYPRRLRGLHSQLVERGCVVSELPPGFEARRWCFVARNRLIAALAGVTVVVEAATRSGSLTTADFAANLGRTVAAVPGPVTSPLSAGCHDLIATGAALVTSARDVLEELAGIDGVSVAARVAVRAEPADPVMARVLYEVACGRDSLAALTGVAETRDLLVALTELELLGRLRRDSSGRYSACA